MYVGGLLKIPFKGKSHGFRRIADEPRNNGLMTDASFYVGLKGGAWTAAFSEMLQRIIGGITQSLLLVLIFFTNGVEEYHQFAYILPSQI